MGRQVVKDRCGSCRKELGEGEHLLCLGCEISQVEQSLRSDSWLKIRSDIVIREMWEYLVVLRRKKESRDECVCGKQPEWPACLGVRSR